MTALEALATESRWVAWRNESRGERATKVPYAPGGGRGKSDDPATWGTRAAAEAQASAIVNGTGGGIGIVLGDLGGDTFLAGIDLDSCLSPEGALAPWAATIVESAPTYAETSPSGFGLKLFFYIAAEDVRPFLDRIGAQPSQWGVRRDVPGEDSRDHGPAVEVYFSHRYFTVTGQKWPTSPADLAMLERMQLGRLADLIPPARATATGQAGADNSRSAIAFRRGLALCRDGATFDQMCETLRADPETSQWCREKGDGNGGRELHRIWEKATIGPGGGSTDIGRANVAWPDPPSQDAFYGLAGDVVRAIGPHTEADPAAILVQFLAAFGNAVGRGPHYRVESDRHCTNIYLVLIGKTGKGRKGTSWRRIGEIMGYADLSWCSRVKSGLSSGEGLIYQVRDPTRGMVREGKGANSRIVEVETDLGEPDKRLLILEEEFVNVLNVKGREGNTVSGVIRQAWDQGSLATLVKNSPIQATGALVSIIGHITSHEIRQRLDESSMANGFANRFLFLCVKRARLLPFGGDLADDVLRELGAATAAALDAARKLDRVNMTDEARAAWIELYPELSTERDGLSGAILSRAEAQVVRVALLYALADRAAAIGLAHLRAAHALWVYCEASVRCVFGEMTGDPVADEIMRALRLAAARGMSRTDIRDLLHRHASATRINEALALLRNTGRASIIERRDTGGRPAEWWFCTMIAG